MDRTAKLVEGIRQGINGGAGIDNQYTQNWTGALNNAKQGAADYLSAMQSGQASVAQKQQAQGLGTLQAGLGNGMNRGMYMQAANSGSQGLNASGMARAGEMAGANQNYGNTMFGVGGGFGQQAQFQQGAQQWANDQALQQQAAYQGQDATQTNQTMGTIAQVAGAVGAGAMMMSDSRAKEDAFEAGRSAGMTDVLGASAAQDIARERGVPVLDHTKYYPQLRGEGALNPLKRESVDPQAYQPSPVLQQLATNIGVEARPGNAQDPRGRPLVMATNEVANAPVLATEVNGITGDQIQARSKQVYEEGQARALNDRLARGATKLDSVTADMRAASRQSLDAAKQARADALGLGSSAYNEMPGAEGYTGIAAPTTPTENLAGRFVINDGTLGSAPIDTSQAYSLYSQAISSDKRAKELEDELATAYQTINDLKSPRQKESYVPDAEFMGPPTANTPTNYMYGDRPVSIPPEAPVEQAVPAGSVPLTFDASQAKRSGLNRPGGIIASANEGIDRALAGPTGRFVPGGPIPGNRVTIDEIVRDNPEFIPGQSQTSGLSRPGGIVARFGEGVDRALAGPTATFIPGGPIGSQPVSSDKSVKKAATPRLKRELVKRGELSANSIVGGATDEMMDKLEPHIYRYKDSAPKGNIGALPSEQARPGIMAQDLEKSKLGKTLVLDTPKGKMVDMPAASGANMAMIAQLHKRLKKVEGK